jgi:hypothetical protein
VLAVGIVMMQAVAGNCCHVAAVVVVVVMVADILVHVDMATTATTVADSPVVCTTITVSQACVDVDVGVYAGIGVGVGACCVGVHVSVRVGHAVATMFLLGHHALQEIDIPSLELIDIDRMLVRLFAFAA